MFIRSVVRQDHHRGGRTRLLDELQHRHAAAVLQAEIEDHGVGEGPPNHFQGLLHPLRRPYHFGSRDRLQELLQAAPDHLRVFDDHDPAHLDLVVSSHVRSDGEQNTDGGGMAVSERREGRMCGVKKAGCRSPSYILCSTAYRMRSAVVLRPSLSSRRVRYVLTVLADSWRSAP